MSEYEPDPGDQFAATTLDRAAFDGPIVDDPKGTTAAAPRVQAAVPQGSSSNVPAAQPSVAPRSEESDFTLMAALAVVVGLAALLAIFLIYVVLTT